MIAQPDPSFRVIEVADNLDHWNLNPEHLPYIARINTVYLQETNTAWYMASSTPGYCAEPLYSKIDFKNDPSDEIREAIEDYVDSSLYDNEPTYFTHLNDRFKSVPISLSDEELAEFHNEPNRDLALRTLWESLIEDCKANHRI